jgi:hypothetical protein
MYAESESPFLHDFQFTTNESVLATSPSRLTTSNSIFQLNTCNCGSIIVYNCCRSSPAQSISDPSPAALITSFYCLKFETPPTCRARSPYLYPQEQGGPVIPPPPGTGVSFRHLLCLAGRRWRYSSPPPQVRSWWLKYM